MKIRLFLLLLLKILLLNGINYASANSITEYDFISSVNKELLRLFTLSDDVKEAQDIKLSSGSIRLWLSQDEIKQYFQENAEELCSAKDYPYDLTDDQLLIMENLLQTELEIDCSNYSASFPHYINIATKDTFKDVNIFLKRHKLNKNNVCNRKRLYLINSEEHLILGEAASHGLGDIRWIEGFDLKRKCQQQDRLYVYGGHVAYPSLTIGSYVHITTPASCEAIPISEGGIYSHRIKYKMEENQGMYDYDDKPSLLMPLGVFEKFCSEKEQE